jgi:DNA-binding transcriptional LysR family regulator
LSREPNQLLRERIVQALRASKIPFNFGVENVGIEAIKRMVINGLGVGFVPTMCVSEEVVNGKLVLLKSLIFAPTGTSLWCGEKIIPSHVSPESLSTSLSLHEKQQRQW